MRLNEIALRAAVATLVATASLAAAGDAVVATPILGTSDDGRTVRAFHLYATDGVLVAADGAELYVWGYSLQSTPGTATLPGPRIEVHEGDLVEITLTNVGPSREGVHRFPHTIHLHGLDVDQRNDGVPETSPSVRVGESFTYRFVATHAGTYWYHCHVDTIEHLTMGMYGAIVVHPADGPGRVWTGGPGYDRSYTLLLSEVDPAWSEAIGADRTPDRSDFRPRYFFVNGRSFPDTMDHDDTHVMGYLGERVLIRLINAGYGWRSMHMHGFHFDVVATDGRPLPQPYAKDTLSIAPGERYDILVTLDQLGSYPFHSHVLLDNLNDGAYPGGIHTMVSVREVGERLDVGGHAHHAVPVAEPSAARVRTVGGFPGRAAAPREVPPLGAAVTSIPDGAVVIEMRDDRFHPEHLVVRPGTTVVWVNADPRTHTVVSDAFASHDVHRNTSFGHTFDAPGVYAYECVNHRGMTGVVSVR